MRSINEKDIRAVVLTGAGGNFCSGGDVEEIIGPLVDNAERAAIAPGCCRFTTMTGDLVKSMRACPQPIVAAIDGICAGAGAILAMASDLRIGTARSRVGFLFVRVGLSGADMGACAHAAAHHRPGPRQRIALHRPIHGRRRGRAVGFLQRARRAGRGAGRRDDARAKRLAAGPTFAHAITKRCLHDEWDMSVDDGDRGGGRRRRRCAWRPRTSPAAYRAFMDKAQAEVRRGLMADRTYLDWPFFDDAHRGAGGASSRRGATASSTSSTTPIRRRPAAPTSRNSARAGWLKYAVPRAYGGALDAFDVRSICLIRETLGYASGLAEFAFAMQGLGSGPISLFGSEALKKKYLPGVAAGSSRSPPSRSPKPAPGPISRRCRRPPAATAHTSSSTARRRGFRTRVSPAHYVVFCRWPEGGERSFIALVVDAGTPGLDGEPRRST